jgi:DNA polymerase-3 subunit epsilon/oligoribonuclease
VLGIFLDIETNGLNPYKHKAIEIAFKIIDIETSCVVDSYDAIVFQSYEEWQNSDVASLQINGFNWEQISFGKSQEQIANEITECFTKHDIKRGKAVFICQNPSFDRAFFSHFIDPDVQEKRLWPYHWLDLASMHWTRSLLKEEKPWEIGLSKDKIAAWYHIAPENKPHRAMNGVNHLLLCYQAVFQC